MLEWNCITGCYEIEIPEHLKFYTTQKKSAPYQHSRYNVLSNFQGNGGERVGADIGETRKIRYLHFIAPRKKNQTHLFIV